MQTQDNTETCYRRGNQNTWRKTFLHPRPFKPKSIHYYISWSNEYQKHPPSLIYPMYLSPPSSSYQQTSRNLVFTSYSDLAILPDCIRQASPTFFGKSQMLPKLQNTFYTLNRYEYKSPLKV